MTTDVQTPSGMYSVVDQARLPMEAQELLRVTRIIVSTLISSC
jgi:hypothetical protein